MSEFASSSYLEQALQTDRAERDRLLQLIDETAATLVLARSGEAWGYAVRSDGHAQAHEDEPARISASTNAMVAFALATTAGIRLAGPLASGIPAESLLGPRAREALRADGDEPAKALVATLEPVIRTVSANELDSATYGPNDPFTLGWLVPLVAALDIGWNDLAAAVNACFVRAWERPENRPWPIFEPPPPVGTALPHAFPLLRLVHLSETITELGHDANQAIRAECAEAFEATVHRQLANNTIADASFDAAELIFAFEGLLRTAAGPPSEALVDRFFEAVGSSQEQSPSWRPLRPFIGSNRGLVLLPLSVEGASSLARICRLLDALGDRASRFMQNVELFRKYVQWLSSQRVHIVSGGRDLQGWHSEHVREEGTLYTWQTSQVLLFLLLYVELLQRHMAAQALSAANLSIKHRTERGPSREKSESWGKVWRTFLREPAGPVPEEKQPAKTPSAENAPEQNENRSAVLFGPPGTGKTTLAEWLASELGWPLITITPSDFMAEGTAAVEARAKAVFTALLEQRQAVVVFDEIDRLILDRDLDEYREQEDAFQLMTPSMLTKLNDLRRTGAVIFLVATNYVELIDRAITRPGRFDEQLAILPPNLTERTTYLEEGWTKKTGNGVDLRRVGELTWFATFAELKALVRNASSVEELRAIAANFQPAISLEGYESRMRAERKPSEEVLRLAEFCPQASITGVAEQVVDAAKRDSDESEARLEKRRASSA